MQHCKFPNHDLQNRFVIINAFGSSSSSNTNLSNATGIVSNVALHRNSRMSYTFGHFVPFYFGQKYMTSLFLRNPQKNQNARIFSVVNEFI